MNTRARDMIERFATIVAVAMLIVATACSSPEPGATTATSEEEIAGMHSPNDLNPVTAQRWIDHVHLGTSVDDSGKIPAGSRSDAFLIDETIRASMEVTDAPAGSMVRLAVVPRGSNESVWEDERSVEAGRSHLIFEIGTLPQGEYRANVVVGDETVFDRSFTVSETSGS